MIIAAIEGNGLHSARECAEYKSTWIFQYARAPEDYTITGQVDTGIQER